MELAREKWMILKESKKIMWHDLHVLLRSDDYAKLAHLAEADQRKPAVYC